MGKLMRLTYASSISGLCAVNSSFDAGVLRVAYTDDNRNGSFISKETYERCIKTIYNCPVVCNYNREEDSIGGHDMELVEKDGRVSMVNVTQPVGMIPESAKYGWEMVEEEDGSVHEYLCVDVLLWKRQEAYRKIKEDGITSESMEITVKDGKFDRRKGLYVVNDFEFTAFCLLGDGVEPCFEQAALETFAHSEFKEQMTEMMKELRESYAQINTHNEKNEIDIKGNEDKDENFQKGGNEKLEEKLALVKEFGMTVDELEFALDDVELDDLKMRLEEMKCFEEAAQADAGNAEAGAVVSESADHAEDAAVAESEPENTEAEFKNAETDGQAFEEAADNVDEASDAAEARTEETQTEAFALNGQVREAICHALSCGECVEKEWGQEPRYCFVDFDADEAEVYVMDVNDWNLYGFGYSMNGDNAVIEWDGRKRKKYAIVDFEDGESVPESAGAFSHFEENYQKRIRELEKFKLDVEEKRAAEDREAVLEQFADLNDNEAFELLKENAAKYDAETLEEKCFAIRGRMSSAAAKFALENRGTRIPVTPVINMENEPYGGLFRKYGKAVRE